VLQDNLSYPMASLVMVSVIAVILDRVMPATLWDAAVASANWALVLLRMFALLGASPWLPPA
jgi:hypothetical protein